MTTQNRDKATSGGCDDGAKGSGWDVWADRVVAVVDQAHAENWGGKHRQGFCEACADAHIVAQYAVPGGPS